jgi:hypothetical protein
MAFPVPYAPALSRCDSMPYRRWGVVRVSLSNPPAILFPARLLD